MGGLRFDGLPQPVGVLGFGRIGFGYHGFHFLGIRSQLAFGLVVVIPACVWAIFLNTALRIWVSNILGSFGVFAFVSHFLSYCIILTWLSMFRIPKNVALSSPRAACHRDSAT